jgi:hypothetical protein
VTDTVGVALLVMNSWVLDLVKSVSRIVSLLLILVVISLGVIRPAQDKAFAQSPQYWAKTYGGGSSDRAYCVQQTSDSGYIVAGSTQSFGAGDWDFWILKIVADGSIDWQKTYGGISNERAYSIKHTFDGGYIVGGYTWSFGAGDSDFCILAHQITKAAEQLTYRQLCILKLAVVKQIFGLRSADYRGQTSFPQELYQVLHECLDLYLRGFINFGGTVAFGLTDIAPGKMTVQGLGADLFNSMKLVAIPDEDIVPIASQLK